MSPALAPDEVIDCSPPIVIFGILSLATLTVEARADA